MSPLLLGLIYSLSLLQGGHSAFLWKADGEPGTVDETVCHKKMLQYQNMMVDLLLNRTEQSISTEAAEQAAKDFNSLSAADQTLDKHQRAAVDQALDLFTFMIKPKDYKDGSIPIFWSGFYDGSPALEGKMSELNQIVDAHGMVNDAASFALNDPDGFTKALFDAKAACSPADPPAASTLLPEAKIWWVNYSNLFVALAWKSSQMGKYPLLMINNKPYVSNGVGDAKLTLEATYFIQAEIPKLIRLASKSGRTAVDLHIFSTHEDCTATEKLIHSYTTDGPTFAIECTECMGKSTGKCAVGPMVHLETCINDFCNTSLPSDYTCHTAEESPCIF